MTKSIERSVAWGGRVMSSALPVPPPREPIAEGRSGHGRVRGLPLGIYVVPYVPMYLGSIAREMCRIVRSSVCSCGPRDDLAKNDLDVQGAEICACQVCKVGMYVCMHVGYICSASVPTKFSVPCSSRS